jgi:hypothetical protein
MGIGATQVPDQGETMTPTAIPGTLPSDTVTLDVFAAARWFDSLWNSSAKAVSAEEVEWQCTTWGSGCGRGGWEHTATFTLVAAVFGLPSSRNRAGRDELVVSVPLGLVPEIVRLIDRLGEEAECWPWFVEEDRDRQVSVAAEVLGLSPTAVADDVDLRAALRIH